MTFVTTTTTTTTHNEHDISIFQKILDSPAPYAGKEEQEICKKLILSLSEVEIDAAAKTSYAYWYLASQPEHYPSESARINMAMREARRHFIGEGKNFKMALRSIKEAISIRKQFNIETLRTLFNPSVDSSIQDAKLRSHLESSIALQLKNTVACVHGLDRDGRAIVSKRLTTGLPKGATIEDFVALELYTTERALAVTEFVSQGRNEKILAIFDYRKQTNKPPLSALKLLVPVLQRVYPERIRNLVMVQPPLAMRAIYTIVKPFLAPATQEKICLVTKSSQDQILSELMANPEEIDSPIDMEKYLGHVPFHQLYNSGL